MNLSLDNPLFLIPATSGLIFIIAGLIMSQFPPKKINAFYGYRTNSSMKNQEQWDFSQTYAAKEMAKLGSLLLMSGVLGFVFHTNDKTEMVIGMGLMILMVVILLIRVEKAIKKEFNNT
ncbi:MAG: SdpI family protein [Psychroserpens sp.]|uniref:SdpI family protein n=1 Tax=Psychroserpens sp. TaxID=2020870 RepID=UPI003C8A7D62